MDPSTSKRSKDNRSVNLPPSPKYELYADERFSRKTDIKKKKIQFRNSPTTDDQITTNSLFQIPESDNSRYLPSHDISYGKSPKYSGKPSDNTDKPESYNYSSNRTVDQGKPAIIYTPSKNDREKSSNDKRFYTEDITYTDPTLQTDSYGNAMKENPSLICRAVNYDGEPVSINNEVVKNKLILSCRPRSYYGNQFRKPVIIENERTPNYIYPPTQAGIIDDLKIQRARDIEYQEKMFQQHSYLGGGKSPLRRSNAYDQGSMGLGSGGIGNAGQGEMVPEGEQQSDKYEEQYRAIQCKRYTKNFRTFLWLLFIINTLLVLVGLSLLMMTLSHNLFRNYMNVVIDYTGFYYWIWAAFIISVLIIIVGIYGIITSITRAKKMIITYCVLAAILIFIIVIFLLIFWIMHGMLNRTERSSMKTTFNMYRCERLIRVAWDTLHVQQECCGIDGRGDWKYVPPSCCHAQTRFQQLACINHYIQEEQAYKSGCRGRLEEYFTTMFLLITVLLILAIILLLLGILAALRLLKMYKVILMCRDLYLISS